MTDDDPTGRLVVSWLPTDHVEPAVVVRLVSEFAGTPTDGLRVVRACRRCGSDRHGKPHVVVPGGTAPMYVSLSRSGGRAAVAVTDAGPLGVDIEIRQPSDQDLTTWVRTESLMKATGHGLTIDPALIDEGPSWTVDVAAPDGFVAAATVLTIDPPRVITLWAAPEG